MIIKRYILKDSRGKYYTKYYDRYWSGDKEDAYSFENDEEIIKEFPNLNEDNWDRKLDDVLFPIEEIAIYIKIKTDDE